MAQTSWPFETIDTTETQFSQWARHIGEGVNGTPGSTYLEPYADSTGMFVKVKAGQANVRGHYYDNSTTVSLAVSTADGTNPRIDAIVLELDPTANTITAKVIAGTPASTPVAPTLTQTDGGVYQFLLGTVSVPAGDGGISSDQVTDLRTFLGYRFGIWTTATRPSSPAIGRAGLNTTLGFPEYWNGSAWTSLVIQTVSNPTVVIPQTNISSATYTIQNTDQGYLLRFTSASAVTVTIPSVLTVGQRVDILQSGAGQITFVGSGITLNSANGALKMGYQHSAASILCVASGVYTVVGDLVA